MKKIFISWIGDSDLSYYSKNINDKGMLIAFMKSEHFSIMDECHLLYNKNSGAAKDKVRFINFIKDKILKGQNFYIHEFDIAFNDYRHIYKSAASVIESIKIENSSKINLFYHLSSGTPQAAAVWVVFSKSKYPGTLYMTYKDKNDSIIKSKVADIPFDVDESYIQYLEKKSDMEFLKMWSDIPEYESIIHESATMRLILNKAFKVAPHDIPVLILGETGTGKELFAMAIHKSSKRIDKPFITINCSAIHEETSNATLFGWSKGAWTGSHLDGKGYFLDCDGGTIFLDEIGDLSLDIQTKLLRVLQYGEVQRVGDGKTFHADVRIIAATNRDLRQMVIDGKFREDLFYRINVAVLKLPPLRERGTDSIIIAEHFLEIMNDEYKTIGNKYITVKFSDPAKKFIENYRWPGNIRELYHTIQRAYVWNETGLITEEDIKTHLLEPLQRADNENISLSKETPINLEEISDRLKKKYIVIALELTNNNKTETAKLLGYKSYQTLTNIMKKVGIEL